ncbi:MAG TPA: cytochrome c [Terracidiphilus sp.]|nr:cytochrome c [Terracidiphilus sp.]
MLKPFLLQAAVLSLAVALMPSSPSPGPGGETHAKAPAKPAVDPLEHARAIYKIDCALCHGENGDGKTDVAKDMGLVLNDWTDPKALAGKSDQELFDIIRKGKDKMPPEAADRAKDEDVRNLITLIRGMAKATPGTPAAATTPTIPSPPSAPAPQD